MAEWGDGQKLAAACPVIQTGPYNTVIAARVPLDEMIERGAKSLNPGTWTAPDGSPCRPDEIAHAVLSAALRTERD